MGAQTEWFRGLGWGFAVGLPWQGDTDAFWVLWFQTSVFS